MRNRRQRLSALLLACCMLTLGAASSFAEERDIILGENPAREDAADSCEMMLVQDAETGETLYVKEERKAYAVNDMPVLWMCALTALDYLSMSDKIESNIRDFGFPAGTNVLGIKRGQSFTVRDLIAATVLTGAADAAVLLRNAAMDKAASTGAITMSATPTPSGGRVENAEAPEATANNGYKDFNLLMDKKAAELGMSGTHYIHAWGLGDPNQVTNVRDQMLLFNAIMENPALFRILRLEQYTMETQNKGINATIRQSAPLIDSKSGSKDKRVVAYAGGSDTDGVQCVFYGQTDVRDIIAVFWCPNATETEGDMFCTQILDQYAAIDVVDILEDVSRSARNLSIRYDGNAVTNWAVDAEKMEYDAFAGFTVEADKLELVPDESTINVTEDGYTEVRATVVYDGVALESVQLTTDRSIRGGKATIEKAPLYTEVGETPPPTLMEEYGWAFLIGGAALLAILVYVLGRVIRERIEY